MGDAPPSHRNLRVLILYVVCVGSTNLAAQQPELSHVERFLSPQTKLNREVHRATQQLQKNPSDAKAYDDRGLARLRQGKVDAGLEDLKRAITLPTANSDTYASLALGLWMAGRLPEALDAARQAVKLDAKSWAAQYYTGRLLVDTGGDVDEAIQHLEDALALNPEEIGGRFDLLNAYRQKGDLDRAGVQLRLLRLELPPTDARLLYAQGLFETDLGNLPLAIDDFRLAIAASPRLDTARLDLGVALIKTERWQEALDELSGLAKDVPDSYPASYFHALALQNTQHAAQAEQEIRRAIVLNPQSSEALTLLGILLSERGAYADAIAALKQAVQFDPKSYDPRFYLGRALYAQQDFGGARDAFRAAAQLRPDDVDSRFFLATVAEAMGDNGAALALYRSLTTEHSQDPRGFIGLGGLLAKTGQLDDAVAPLEHARQLDPNNFEACLSLGRVFLRQGQLEDAIVLLQSAITLGPQSVDAHYQLGLALRRAGHEQEAAEQFAIVDRLNREYRSGQTGMSRPPKEK